MTQKDAQQHNDLPEATEQKALKLVECHVLHPSDKTRKALEAFSQISSQHFEAVQQAKKYVQAGKRLTRPKRSWQHKLVYMLELEFHRILDMLKNQIMPIMAVAASAVLFMLLINSKHDQQLPPVAQLTETQTVKYQTKWRETRDVVLQDGSVLWLGSDSIAQVRFTPQQRSVTLVKGQAGFQVTKNKSRPFVVTAGSVTTTVTGTEFTVNMFDSRNIEVAVAEGQVQVALPEQPMQVLNAQQVVVAEDFRLTGVNYRSEQSIGSWREGSFVFEERRLAEVIREILPYSQYELDTSWIGDSVLNEPVSGVFFTQQADDALFTVLQSKGLTVEHIHGKRLRAKRIVPVM